MRPPTHTGAFAHPPTIVEALGMTHGMIVGDFGAGSGAHTLLMAEAVGEKGRVYAVDVQRDLLRRIKNEAGRRGYKNVEIICGDLEEDGGTKIADRALDLVLISNTLFQLTDQRAVFAECWRVLKPAGVLAVVDWSDESPTQGGRFGPHRDHLISKDECIALAEKEAFKLTDEFAAGAHHYGLLFHPVPRRTSIEQP